VDHNEQFFDEVTIEVWLYPKTLDGWRAIRNDAGWSTGDIHFQFLNSKLEFSLHSSNPTDQWFSQPYSANQWYHIAIVYSVSDRSVTLYLNGDQLEVKRYSSAVASGVSEKFFLTHYFAFLFPFPFASPCCFRVTEIVRARR
jgi:hypothetical protein